MNQNIKVAVLGGGGRTGGFLVNQLVYQGYRLKLLLRNPDKFSIESPLIEIIEGDALDADAIDSLVEGCRVVISTVGQRKDEPLVSSQATLNILNSMFSYGLKRYILVAGLNVYTPSDTKSAKTAMATKWMKVNFPLAHEDRQLTYSILSESRINWTMVRVPLIEFSDIRGEIGISPVDCPGDKISAANIAAFLIEQITDTHYFQKSPFIANI
jgi:putative NADH-flavin reductase